MKIHIWNMGHKCLVHKKPNFKLVLKGGKINSKGANAHQQDT